MSATPARAALAMRRSPSARVTANGLSMTRLRPASIAASARATWLGVAVAITTRSSSPGRLPELSRRGQYPRARVLPGRRRHPAGVRRHDRVDPVGGVRRDQRPVEHAPGQAEAYDPGADRARHASVRLVSEPISPPTGSPVRSAKAATIDWQNPMSSRPSASPEYGLTPSLTRRANASELRLERLLNPAAQVGALGLAVERADPQLGRCVHEVRGGEDQLHRAAPVDDAHRLAVGRKIRQVVPRERVAPAAGEPPGRLDRRRVVTERPWSRPGSRPWNVEDCRQMSACSTSSGRCRRLRSTDRSCARLLTSAPRYARQSDSS